MSTLTQVSYRFNRDTPIADRLLDSFVCSPSGCWEWVRTKSTGGYGSIGWKGKTYQAHRAVYELLVGKIPLGLVADHLCNNPGCVNPSHISITTQKHNVLRSRGLSAENARKILCKRGHELDKVNAKGHRSCSTCKRQYYYVQLMHQGLSYGFGCFYDAELSAHVRHDIRKQFQEMNLMS